MSKLERYIKDTAAALCLVDNFEIAENFNPNVVNKFLVNCFKNYAAFRLELLTSNEDYIKIKRDIVTKLTKLGVKYAINYFNIPISNDDVDKYVEKYLPVVIDYVSQKQIQLFTKMQEAADSE